MSRYSGYHICGLYYINGTTYQRAYFPQVELRSHTTINPVCFTTRLTQTFHNPNVESLEQVRYTFPLYDGVAVNGYTISYGDKVLKGIVKQKDDAKKTYQAAVDRGETAGLLESLPAGTFGVTLGNVPSRADVLVEITYCGELKHDAAIDGLRYMLPTSIAPRYGDYPGDILKSNAVSKGGISITVDVDMARSAIRRMQSPSHPIAVAMGAVSTTEGGAHAPFLPSQASATLTLGTTELAQDFVLQLLIDDISKPQAIIEAHPTLPNQRALMTTFVPKFTLEPMHPEICFIADQSGSMSGSKNTALVSALKVFLKSLPIGVRFNICAFGSDFKFLFPKSRAYNGDNVNTALAFVDSFTASYGGTEILKPITAAFKQRLADLPLEVMLLTDGEVWNEGGVFTYINEQIHSKGVDARIFALGIGGDVSHTLVEGVARAGNGFAQFVTQSEDTDQKVVRMLKGALYAHTKNYAIEVNYGKDKDTMTDEEDFEIVEKINDFLHIEDRKSTEQHIGRQEAQNGMKAQSFFDKDADVDKPMKTEGVKAGRDSHLPLIETPKLLQAPNKIPPLFPFNRTTLYVLLGPQSTSKAVKSITLRAMSAQGPLELTIQVTNSSTTGVATVHQLAARKAIQDLEEGRGWVQAARTIDGKDVKTKYMSREDEIMERECVMLGEKFQVVGKYTSFVAVEDGSGQEEEVENTGQKNRPSEHIFEDEGRVASHKKKKVSGTHFTSASSVPAAGGGIRNAFSSTTRYVNPETFGASQVSASRTGSLFGNATGVEGNGNGLFGSIQATESTSGSPFGATQNTSGGLFGANHNTSVPSESIFSRDRSTQDLQSGHGLFGFNIKLNPDRRCRPARAQAPFACLEAEEDPHSTASADFVLEARVKQANLETERGTQSIGSSQLTSPSSPLMRSSYPTPFKESTPNHQALSSLSAASAPASQPQKFGAPGTVLADDEALMEEEESDEDMGFGLIDYSDDEAALSFPHQQSMAMACRKAVTPTGGAFDDELYSTDSFDPTQAMHDIIALQTFAGGWPLTEQFLAKLGINAASLNKTELGGSDEVCATALAISFLQTKVPQKSDVWELVVLKAKAWLAKQLTEQQIEKIIESAAAYL